MNRNTKSLSLRKETLVELSNAELDGAAGGYIINNNSVFKPNDTSFGSGSRINDTIYWRHWADPGFAPHNLPRFPQHPLPRELPRWPQNAPVYTIARRQPSILI
jgi:hypothetical protein